MISAHVGNFEIADFFFGEIDDNSQIHLVTTNAEHADIKKYLESVTSKSNIRFIIVREDHVFKIKTALDNGQLVCFMGGHYFEEQKKISESILGKETKFPVGPFLLSSRLNVPVLFVYVMKETSTHYHLYAKTAKVTHKNARTLLRSHVQSVSWILEKHPLQWFDYFDFWNTKEAK